MEPLIVFFSVDFAKIGSEMNNGAGTVPRGNKHYQITTDLAVKR